MSWLLCTGRLYEYFKENYLNRMRLVINMQKEAIKANEQSSRLTFVVILVSILLVSNIIFLLYTSFNLRITGETVSSGVTQLIASAVCGDDVCSNSENCAGDSVGCADIICYEPACSNGCVNSAVADGGSDEACDAVQGCGSLPCQCDGAGNCESVSAPAPVTAPSAPGGGGGGGPGRKEPIKETIAVEPEILKTAITVNEESKRELKISNLGDTILNIKLSVIGNVKDIIELEYDNIILKKGEEQVVKIDIFSKNVGVFIGKIIVDASGNNIRYIPALIEVESESPIFDVSVDIPDRDIFPGENLTAIVTVYNLKKIGDKVYLDYLIKDMNGKGVLSERETVETENKISLTKIFKISEDSEIGDYVFIVQAVYADSFGTASEIFHVIERARLELPFGARSYGVLILIIIIVLLIIANILYYQHKRLKNISSGQAVRLEKINENIKKKENAEILKNKLGRELGLLEKAYENKYISERAYKKGKNRIKDLLSKLGK